MMRALAIGLTLILANVGLAQEPDATETSSKIAKKVLEKAQGKWKLKMETNGEEILSIKEIKGNKETVSRYRGDELIAQWSVDFDIVNIEGVSVFTFRNVTVTAGPNKGQVMAGPFSYLFKIHDDQWHEFHGLPEGDERKPTMTVYKRYDADDEDDDDDDDD